MRNIYAIITCLFLATTLNSQTPELMSYQAIVRDANDALVQNGNIGIQISILKDSDTGTSVYTETHTITTNDNGLVTLSIGSGASSDDFSTIDWSTGTYYIKSETDPTGGANYSITGTSQLLSVPYALYAKNTGNSDTITLTSPNGTEYELAVNDNGELSLPTSNTSSSTPTNLYLYGSFNNWDAANALEFGENIAPYNNSFIGMKYFSAGTELKFLAAQNESIIYGGTSSSSGTLVENGDAILIPNNGFYKIITYINGGDIEYSIESINVTAFGLTMNYDSTNDQFTINLSDFVSSFTFSIDNNSYGDNLADLSIEYQGAQIANPYYNSGFPLDVVLKINFNISGSYTIF